MRLGHAHRDGADSRLGHELHRDRGGRIDVLQVVDQLGEVFYRVDVVVWRRRDERDAGRRVPDARDRLVHLGSGELSSFAGLGALRDLDLELRGTDEVLRGHAEARGRHLLDGAVALRAEALRVLAAFAGVAAAADPVHGDRHRLVRFAAQRAKGHRAGDEAFHDLGRRLDFGERYGLALDEIEQSANR